jgi:hypothetical protein
MTVTAEGAAGLLALVFSQTKRALCIARAAAIEAHEDTVHLDGSSCREAIDDHEVFFGARVVASDGRERWGAGSVIGEYAIESGAFRYAYVTIFVASAIAVKHNDFSGVGIVVYALWQT